ncbi:Ubiquinone biosynthesis O-methyltransferase [Pelotomaculum schinkii]|uniref:Ubiquinone biosynthesis O-methyltransferase n=2 Tax=Pelotomaculum TaxID=191373 RepID=A0A4Y7R6M6_9FIRM|nr:class I SAM-dependent methyltransferase [Pelotomaculum schinkii]TEB04406.1 Ubiquinone biosynthesis O-methyltransferase [Pelotomaculum schinkii]TEB15253.1 Ubiquinone biosynthesis O-methyltransferase [Pelotomaculum sp. FP]
MNQDYRQELHRHNLMQTRYYEHSKKPHMVPQETLYLRRHVDELLRFAGIVPGERLLEVGCGKGRYTLLLAQRGLQVEGLDLSPFLLEQLRLFDGGRYNISLHCTDIADHPPALDGQFDAVVGFFVLHHLHSLPLCFKAITRLLKHGGRVSFLEPNPYNFLYYVQLLVTPEMTWQGDKGIMRMRPSSVFHAMKEAGFRRLKMTRFGFFPPFLVNRPWGARLESTLERVVIWRPFLPFQLFRGELP